MGAVERFDPWHYERKAGERGCRRIAGIDEAGRGPLAGPVVAAAVVLPPDFHPQGVRDSKKLSPLQREDAYERITQQAAALGVGVVGPDEIDRINILQATYKAMLAAIASLGIEIDHALVDGRAIPGLLVPQQGIPHGDSLSVSIAAASIIAKVTRDRIMMDMDARHPGYGFGKHKGYCTAEHVEAINRLGVCEIHRKTFAPISGEVESSCPQRSLF